VPDENRIIMGSSMRTEMSGSSSPEISSLERKKVVNSL